MVRTFVISALTLLTARVGGSPIKGVSQDDIFIAVKTAGIFHNTRLSPILDTWHRNAKANTFFFTDTEDKELERRLPAGHLINTGCPGDHSRTALSCKMEAELTAFLTASTADWFCHIDDDNYLNVDKLVEAVSRFPASQPWYLGKVSIPDPLEILDRLLLPKQRKVRFWFATGGAGFCLSRPLVELMRPWIVDGAFKKLANDIRLPDDVTVGYLSEVLLEVPLKQVAGLHSHLEPLRIIAKPEAEITLSYSSYEDTGDRNVVELEGEQEEQRLRDPTRFYALHCRVRPDQCALP